MLDDNPFSQQVQHNSLQDLPQPLMEATEHDLRILNTLYHLPLESNSQWVKEAANAFFCPFIGQFKNKDNTFLHQQDNWDNCLPELADHYRNNGTGIFAEYKALKWQDNQLIGISRPDPITLARNCEV